MPTILISILTPFLVFSVLIWMPPAFSGQTKTGEAVSASGILEGVVKDPSGAVVPGATIILRWQDKNQKRVQQSNQEGRFRFGDLPASDFQITVEKSEFKDYSITMSHPGGKKALDIILEFSTIEATMVVSATRTETPLENLGVSVTVISSDEVAQSRANSVLELLRDVPGFTVLQTGRRGGITSLFARGGESDFNKVFIDGVPVNDIGGSFNFAHLTPENVDRIEAVRGPQSALFGSDAISSVVQIVSQRGTTTTPSFEYLVEAGSYDFLRQTVGLRGLVKDLDYAATFARLDTDGRFQNDDYRNTVATGNFGWQFSENIDLRTVLRYGRSDLGVPGPVRALNEIGLGPDIDQREEQRDLLLGAHLQQRLREGWEQRFSYYHMEGDLFSFDPVSQDPTFLNDFPFQFDRHPRRRGFQYQSNLRLPLNHLVSFGFDYEHEDASIDGLKAMRNNCGYYLQDQISFGSRLYLTLGARIDDNRAGVPEAIRTSRLAKGLFVPENAGFGFTANPRASLAYFLRRAGSGSFFDATKLKFNFGLGIKEPNMVESFSPNPAFEGNPELRPERTRSFEFGLEQYFSQVLNKLELNYFDNRFRELVDYLVTGFVPFTGTFINSERAFARGVEVSLHLRPMRNLTFLSGYNFVETRFQETLTRPFDPVVAQGMTLLRRPKHSGSASLIYAHQRFSIYFNGTFVGRRNDVNPIFDFVSSPILPNSGFSKVDMAINYHLHPRATFFARVDNLLNHTYEEVLGFPSYRLNFSSGLRVHLGGGK